MAVAEYNTKKMYLSGKPNVNVLRHTGFFTRGGKLCQSRKKQFIYIIWSSHDRETVKQISDENLTNYIIVRHHLQDHF